MSSEQIRLFAKGKIELSQKDIDYVRQQIETTMEAVTSDTRQSIISARQLLMKRAAKVSELCEQETRIRQDMVDYKKKLSDLLQGTDSARKVFQQVSHDLEREKQKLTILQLLKELGTLNCEISALLNDHKITSLPEKIERVKEIGTVLRLSDKIEPYIAKYVILLQNSFDSVLSICDDSFSLRDLDVLVKLFHALFLSTCQRSFYQNCPKPSLQSILRGKRSKSPNAKSRTILETLLQLVFRYCSKW